MDVGDLQGVPVRDGAAEMDTGALRATARRRQPSWLDAMMWPAAAILALFVAVPLFAIVWRAIEYGAEFSAETRATLRSALGLSLSTSVIAMLIVVGFGTPLAYLLARRSFPGRVALDTLVDLPIVLPPAVAGLALLMAFGRRGILGGTLADWGISIPFTTTAVVIAQIFVAVPFYVRAARSGFQRVEPELEEAAADLGAGPVRVFWTVTLPLARPGLAAGAVLAWSRALGEFGATLMFAGNLAGRTQTMPLAIYERYAAGDLTTALVLAILLLVVSLVILLIARILEDRSATDDIVP